MEPKFTEQDSLALIGEMIHRARNNFQKGRMTSVIYWGYVIAAIAFANFILLHTLKTPYYAYLVWLAAIPAPIVSYFIDRRVDRGALVKTHIDKIGDMLWKGFGITVFLFLVAIYLVAYRLQNSAILVLITPVIMLMIGMGQFATAYIYRHKPWFWVTALFWTGGLACALLPQDIQFIVLGVSMILGYAVPGHLLTYQEKSHV